MPLGGGGEGGGQAAAKATRSPPDTPPAKKRCATGDDVVVAVGQAALLQPPPMQPQQQPQQQTQQQPKRGPYLCSKCLLLLGKVKLKSEHPSSGCPAAQGDYKTAEAAAKKEMNLPASKNFDAKLYIQYLVGVGKAAKQLTFSSAARDACSKPA